ncbi:MAG: hypothetical protein JNM31_06330 [Flavobacteriales bacterium]|nr:hypothetical protein [Flavobacteriales bacterium]
MRRYSWLLLLLLLAACSPSTGDRCKRFFEPYPDLVGDRPRTARNAPLLDGMAQYRAGRYAEAIPDLQAYAETDPERRDVAYLYLTSCYLALDKPFDAELQLDYLKQHHQRNYRDEVEWYYALCWLCSDQADRALAQARRIADSGRHTYAVQAAALVKELSR